MADQKANSPGGVDTKALSALIIELNIARRNCGSYPKGHPLIDSSLQKVLRVYDAFIKTRKEVVVGVTRDALLVEDQFLDKQNTVFRDFSGILFERGIGALVFRRGLTIDELRKITIVLSLKLEEIQQHGGIESVWEKARIVALGIRSVRYDLFSTTAVARVGGKEEAASSEGLWERFARGITRGTLEPGTLTDLSDPGLLAFALNHQFASGGTAKSGYAQFVTDFMGQYGTSLAAGNRANPLPYEKLASFISNLNPALRTQFLSSAFDKRVDGNQEMAERILHNLSTDTILETLEEVNRSNAGMPPVVMGLLERLSKDASVGQYGMDTECLDDDDLRHKMQTIFREHASEEFVPDDYQDKLNQIVADQQIPQLGTNEVRDLIDTFDPSAMESRVADILLFLVMDDPSAAGSAALIETINGMRVTFLKAGEYAQVLKILRQMKDERIPVKVRRDIQKHLAQPAFLEEVLNGLATFGKIKYNDISQIIREVGEPFIDALLDRLAEEQSMSLRRFMMERLQEFGVAARNAIGGRLSDGRWYFLRNLIIMIRSMNDSSLIERVRPLLRHENPKVRQEALKTLLHFGDPVAEGEILADLASKEHDVRVTAVRLAEKSSSPKIFQKLLSILLRSGLSKIDYELKSAAVQTLAEIGNADALPHLSRILGSRSIFHPTLLGRLKVDVVRSLERYPSGLAQAILKPLASGKGPLAQQAALSLKNVSGRQP